MKFLISAKPSRNGLHDGVYLEICQDDKYSLTLTKNKSEATAFDHSKIVMAIAIIVNLVDKSPKLRLWVEPDDRSA